ncbi:MAG: hypothetical protein M1820_009241 [Bogoriella megaspora]|nr:MAG: hypothetical protein M1820_009241 [Bogoriella megaspora]
MAASIYSPGLGQIVSEMKVSATIALLPLSFYNLGMAFGPIISSPLSETFGRKAVYLTTIPPFALFILGSGLSRGIGSLVVCRFFAGVFGAPGVSIASASIADIYPPVNRAVPLSFYYAIPFIGSLSGPLIGGYVVEGKGWRWTQWTILFFTVATLSSVVFNRESYKKIILQRLNKASNEALDEEQTTVSQKFHRFITKTIVRPVHMLFTEPIVGFVCLYSSFQFALMYTFVVASPRIFETVYGFGLGSQGLTFLGFIAGVALSIVPLVTIDRLIYQRKFKRFQEAYADNSDVMDPAASEFPPEHRLYSSMLGSLILPIGLFWFAWTAKNTIHWICPVVAQGVAIFGSLLIYVGANLYMMDTYGPLYGASAAGANSLSRYTLSFAFPLFTLQMYDALGIGWATTLLGFCTVCMTPIPWVFFRWGSRLRAKSKYERSF